MQGVGPCQLTWWSLQDEADKAGGCWRPEINMRIGFSPPGEPRQAARRADGARRYNGSGDAAVAYGNDLVAKARKWDAILAGASGAGAGAGVAASRVVRLGDAGPLVEKITRRLSYVRSRKTRAAYLDGARRGFGPKAEAALKAFQAEHGLTADGVFGPATARKLNRAVKLEKARREGGAPAPGPAPGPGPVPVSAPVAKAARARSFRRSWPRCGTSTTRPTRRGRRSSPTRERRRRLLARLRAAKAGGRRSTRRLQGRSPRWPRSCCGSRTSSARSWRWSSARRQCPLRLAAARPAASAAMPSGSATTDPGSTTVAEATVVQAAEGVPTGRGQRRRRAGRARAAAGAAPAHAADLSEAELAQRVVRLDRALDRSRAELVRRYAEVEEELAKLLPAQRQGSKTRGHAAEAARKARARPRKDPKPVVVVVDPSRDPQGGKVVTTKLGDRGLLVRRSKLALARFLAAKGNQEHAQAAARAAPRGPRSAAAPRSRRRSGSRRCGRPST